MCFPVDSEPEDGRPNGKTFPCVAMIRYAFFSLSLPSFTALYFVRTSVFYALVLFLGRDLDRRIPILNDDIHFLVVTAVLASKA